MSVAFCKEIVRIYVDFDPQKIISCNRILLKLGFNYQVEPIFKDLHCYHCHQHHHFLILVDRRLEMGVLTNFHDKSSTDKSLTSYIRKAQTDIPPENLLVNFLEMLILPYLFQNVQEKGEASQRRTAL